MKIPPWLTNISHFFVPADFSADDQRRWGFLVHSSASDYPYFLTGKAELHELGLIVENEKGMIFLNDEGMAFCRENRNAINGGGDVWHKFGAE